MEDSNEASLLGIKVSVVFMMNALGEKADRISCSAENAKIGRWMLIILGQIFTRPHNATNRLGFLEVQGAVDQGPQEIKTYYSEY